RLVQSERTGAAARKLPARKPVHRTPLMLRITVVAHAVGIGMRQRLGHQMTEPYAVGPKRLHVELVQDVERLVTHLVEAGDVRPAAIARGLLLEHAHLVLGEVGGCENATMGTAFSLDRGRDRAVVESGRTLVRDEPECPGKRPPVQPVAAAELSRRLRRLAVA